MENQNTYERAKEIDLVSLLVTLARKYRQIIAGMLIGAVLLGGGGGFAAFAQGAPGLGRNLPVGGGKEGEHPVGLLVPDLPQHKGLCGVEHNMYVSVPGAGFRPRPRFILIVFGLSFALYALVKQITERIPRVGKGSPDCVRIQSYHLSQIVSA